jgi:hypothetical protein
MVNCSSRGGQVKQLKRDYCSIINTAINRGVNDGEEKLFNRFIGLPPPDYLSRRTIACININ